MDFKAEESSASAAVNGEPHRQGKNISHRAPSGKASPAVEILRKKALIKPDKGYKEQENTILLHYPPLHWYIL
jgi:hypothetical protein